MYTMMTMMSKDQYRKAEFKEIRAYMHGGGPSPSGSNFRHSYGLAAVSKAHTSAKGLFPGKKRWKKQSIHQIFRDTNKAK